MDESFERAMSVRRKVLGDDYVDAVTAKATPSPLRSSSS